MPDAFRNGLPHVQKETTIDHAGLVMARYLRSHASDAEKRENRRPEVGLLNSVMNAMASDAYSQAFDRWKRLTMSQRLFVVEAVTAGPLAVGLGTVSPLEIGLTIHHTYGMPVIPGSAIKGLCRCAALQGGLAKESREFLTLFGGQRSAGCFVFHDAWYDPSSVMGKPFHRDVITVHHPRYYGSQGSEWPTDFDDPAPINFLVVKPGVRFLFAITCCSKKWGEYVSKVLTYALTNIGIGAKTNGGYGRFKGIEIIKLPPVPEMIEWRGVQVTRKANPLEFTFTSPTGEAYSRQSARADEINRKFTQEFREWLKKRPTFTADVSVTVTGDQVEITGIVPCEEADG